METVLIFPHQLFENHPCLQKGRKIFLIEDRRFFSEFQFHKQKLVFHRASMKAYQAYLEKLGYETEYVQNDLESVLEDKTITSTHIVELDDVELEKRIKAVTTKKKILLEIKQTPLFLTSVDEFKKFFKGKNHFSCDTFYAYQRKRLNILIDERGKPIGGKWSFDKENRRKLPKSIKIIDPVVFGKNEFVKEAIIYVEKKYKNHPGKIDYFLYATTHKEAKIALRDFLEYRICLFGDFEDAISPNEGIIFHSALSMLINVGLLTPHQVIEETLAYANKNEIPLNSLEGFIRQVIGWREFVRGVYHTVGEKQRKGNFFQHKRKIPHAFYTATTGILPIDDAIKKLLKTAYLHHIERLMILGNFFLISEISPDEIYKWFMELFIDSYDWVMVPNVYGMSQYADEGMMTTKPYFSGSNYILKMSNYTKNSWCEIWDALFWRFMIKHLDFFEKQPRLSILYNMAKTKKSDVLLLEKGEKFLEGVF